MKTESTEAKQANVIPLDGEIDLHVSPRITSVISAALKEKPKKLIIDLTKVSYIDSCGLAVLIEAMQSVEKYGGKFALAGVQENVKPIFEIARLDQVFRIFPRCQFSPGVLKQKVEGLRNVARNVELGRALEQGQPCR